MEITSLMIFIKTEYTFEESGNDLMEVLLLMINFLFGNLFVLNEKGEIIIT